MLNRSCSSKLSFVLITALVIISTGCIAARRNPDLQQIFANARATQGKRPVIVIPGILGSELINSKNGEHVWPTPFRTSEEGLPMNPDLSQNEDDLVPGKIVETVKLARILPEVYVYRDLLEALRHYAGYKEGNWDNPVWAVTRIPSTSLPTIGEKTMWEMLANLFVEWRH